MRSCGTADILADGASSRALVYCQVYGVAVGGYCVILSVVTLYAVVMSVTNKVLETRCMLLHEVCQSSATKVSSFIGDLFLDSNMMATYLPSMRPRAVLFSVIKFRLGTQSLRVETDRWLRPNHLRNIGVPSLHNAGS